MKVVRKSDRRAFNVFMKYHEARLAEHRAHTRQVERENEHIMSDHRKRLAAHSKLVADDRKRYERVERETVASISAAKMATDDGGPEAEVVASPIPPIKSTPPPIPQLLDPPPDPAITPYSLVEFTVKEIKGDGPVEFVTDDGMVVYGLPGHQVALFNRSHFDHLAPKDEFTLLYEAV